MDFPKRFKYSEKHTKLMTSHDKSIVGKKGVKKIYSVEDLLEMPIIAEGTVEEIEREIEEEGKQQER
jgi:hypothetical protein